MKTEQKVSLFKNGRNQAVRIPRDFELPGDEVIIRRQGNCLLLQPTVQPSLLALLNSLEPISDELPDVDDEGLLTLDDIDL